MTLRDYELNLISFCCCCNSFWNLNGYLKRIKRFRLKFLKMSFSFEIIDRLWFVSFWLAWFLWVISIRSINCLRFRKVLVSQVYRSLYVYKSIYNKPLISKIYFKSKTKSPNSKISILITKSLRTSLDDFLILISYLCVAIDKMQQEQQQRKKFERILTFCEKYPK